jgi:hypothetical protein
MVEWMDATMIYALYHILILNAFTVKYIYMFIASLVWIFKLV